MEEIIGFSTWLDRNDEMLKKRFPKIQKTYSNHSTEGFALAVSEELLLCVAICTIATITKSWYAYIVWFGVFAAYAVHLVIHIAQSVIIRKYIPAVATSIIMLPVSAMFLYKCTSILNLTRTEIIVSTTAGLLIIGINLKFAHYLMKRFTLKK